jgi:ABC-type transport system substrate-binding protein
LRQRSLILLAVVASAGACGDADATITTAAGAGAGAAEPNMTTTAATTAPPERFDGQLAGLTVIDDNTFTVELVNPDPEFPLRLARPETFALPDSALEDLPAYGEQPVGNGPFMMDGPWEPDVRIRAVRYPDYQGPDPAKINAYEWILYAGATAAYSDAASGDLDIMYSVPPEFVASASRDFGEDYQTTTSTRLLYLGVPSYLDDYSEQHRQALSMAIDRDLLAETIWPGSGAPAHSVVPPALGGRGRVCENWEFHPERARDLWDAAGGLDEVVVWFTPDGGQEKWIRAVVDMWSEHLGIDTDAVVLEAHEFEDFLPQAGTGQFTGPFRLSWGMDYPSPLSYLEPLFASYRAPPVWSNATFYDNPDFDAAIAAGKEKVGASGLLDAGLADYFAAEDLLCRDVPVIPIRFNVVQLVHSDHVREVHLGLYGDVGYTTIESESGTVRAFVTEPGGRGGTVTAVSPTVLRALNTGLIQFDPQTHQPFNAHARSITSDDGGTTWTIELNPGWTFHDGTPNDATSYVKTWSYRADPEIGLYDTDFYGNVVGFVDPFAETAED